MRWLVGDDFRLASVGWNGNGPCEGLICLSSRPLDVQNNPSGRQSGHETWELRNDSMHTRNHHLLYFQVFQGLTAKPGAAQTRVSLQPFAQHVRQVETSLAYLGQPLAQSDHEAINQAIAGPDEAAAVTRLEQILDKYTLMIADINPESRVKVLPGAAKAELIEAGTRIFLVKVMNKAGVTAQLVAESPNALPIFVPSDLSPERRR